jgi:hypothetical protein
MKRQRASIQHCQVKFKQSVSSVRLRARNLRSVKPRPSLWKVGIAELTYQIED